MTYQPDAEATELAWGNAQRNGARQTRRHLTDVVAMRRLHAQADDPLAIERDADDLADADVPWLVADDPPLLLGKSAPTAALMIGRALLPLIQPVAVAAAAIEQSMARFREATGAFAAEARRLAAALTVEALAFPEPAHVHVERRLRGLAAAVQSDEQAAQTQPIRRLGIDERALSARPVRRPGNHGAAATCPRHGPTRGGLCRRCAR